MANPARQMTDKFGTVHLDDDKAFVGEKILREIGFVGQALGAGMIDNADAVTKEFLDASPNKLATFFVGSYGVTKITTSLLNRYQSAGKLLLNVGGLAYSGLTAADMARDTQRWKTIQKGLDDTWRNGKNISHGVKMTEKEIARTALDGGAALLGLAPLGVEGVGRLSFLKRCKVDPSGCTKVADDLFVKGNYDKAASALKGVLAFAEKSEGDNHLLIGELNDKLARCKFKQIDQFKGLSRVEQILHPTEKLEAEAIKHHKQAIEFLKNTPSEKMDVTDSLIDMGNWYKNENRFGQAHEAYAAALEIREKHFPTTDQLPLATLYEKMADLHHIQKKHIEADGFYAKAIKIIEDKHGPAEGRLIMALDRRGGYAYQNGDFQSSKDFISRALDLKRDKYPAGDHRIGEHIPCLADVLRALGGEENLRKAHALYWEGAIQGESYMYGLSERQRIAGGISACSQSMQKTISERIAQSASEAEKDALSKELMFWESQAKGVPWLAFGEQPQTVQVVRNLTPKQAFNLEV